MDWQSGLVWSAAIIQALGIASLVTIRLANHAPALARYQPIFFVALLAVGAVTVTAFVSNDTTWFSSATTFSVMSVGATLDLREA